jgi:hypothetical protein
MIVLESSENEFGNSREWYEATKQDYLTLVSVVEKQRVSVQFLLPKKRDFSKPPKMMLLVAGKAMITWGDEVVEPSFQLLHDCMV